MEHRTLALARLGRAAPVEILVEPDAELRREIAAALGAEGLRKVRLAGALIPEGRQDWRLEAVLGATAVQACVVTLRPVTTRIDTPVLRVYRAGMAPPEAPEMEMPEDDSEEQLPDRLDLIAVIVEALALALPDYPRAEGVDLGEAVFAPPGTAPLTEAEARPLAGLAALRDRLAAGGPGAAAERSAGARDAEGPDGGLAGGSAEGPAGGGTGARDRSGDEENQG